MSAPATSPWDGSGFEPRERDVAVVGMAGRFPGARDLGAFWRLLAEGREAVTRFSDDELRAAGVPEHLISHPDYVKAGSRLDGIEEFDAGFFGYTAREAELMDPQQRLFLEHAWAALEDAGHDPATYPGLIGTYAGVAWNTYLLSNLREHPALFDGGGGFQVFITNDKDFMPTRVAYKLDLKGPAMIVQTSCSTSLVAIHLAALSLLNYECDMALAGGAKVKVPQEAGYLYQDGGLASPDGHCRAFDAEAAGTIFGSGVGVVVLKRLADALDDGDTVRAVLRGSAVNNDGALKVSYTAPSVEGQAEVVAAAQAVAEVDPRSIGYVECHGTGTSLGDPIEVTALTRVFRESLDGGPWDAPRCALGSVKSNVGHLDAAAGVAGFLKAALALEHRQIPPTINYRTPNPRLDLESSPFRVAAELAEWPAPRNGSGGAPRRAGVSSFGVGGTNAHVVLEEAPKPPAPAPSRPFQLLAVSARSPEALDAATARLAAVLEEGVPAGGSLADAAYTLSLGRRAFARRRFVVARDAADAAHRLAGGDAAPATGNAARGDDDTAPRRAVFLFPGQGAQYPHMARHLYDDEPVFRQELDRAAELLGPLGGSPDEDGAGEAGSDLRDLLFPSADADAEAAAERLRRTEIAQPALFAVEHALARTFMAWGVEPAAMLGHSLGELVAACVAGVFSLADGLSLVAERGRLMQAADEGDMLAVPLPADEVTALLESTGAAAAGVELAAVNQPDRVTVGGPAEAVAAFAAALEADGVGARPLHTSHAFHSAAMDAAVAPFRAAVAEVDLSPPEIPFVSNLTGTWITEAEATDPAYWARHLRHTVRFADGVETLLAGGDRVLLEVGPGDGLSNLVRRHPARGREGQPPQPVVATLPHPRQAAAGDGAPGRAGDSRVRVLEALGRLWLAGVEIDWVGYWGAEARRRLPLPTYPFEGRRYWIDAGPRRAARPAAGGLSDPVLAHADEPAEAGKRADVGSWFYRPTWTEAPPARSAAEAAATLADCEAERWWVLAEGGLGDALARRLRDAGHDVQQVAPGTGGGLENPGEGRWRLRPDAADDWRALAAATGGPPRRVIHAWGLEASPGSWDGAADEDTWLDPKRFRAAQRRGLLSLVALTRALPEAAVDLTVAARGLFQVVATEALDPAVAPLLAVVRVLPEELPGARARAVDPGPQRAGSDSTAHDRLATALLAEALVAGAGGPEEIALRGRQRWLRTFRSTPLGEAGEGRAGGLALPAGGHYLVVGGLAGNGLALARFLAVRGARLTLVDDGAAAAETAESEAAAHRRAEEVAALAGTDLGDGVVLERLDLADATALGRALAAAEERWGSLDGVVHAADTYGERTFRVLAETGAEEAGWNFRPKVEGLAALAAALDGRRPGFVAVVSSLASVLGGFAYGAYTAGCLAADAWVEEHLRRAGDTGSISEHVPWLALDLDVWQFETAADGAEKDETGDAVQLTDLRSDLAELAMTPREGEDAFARAVAALPEVEGRLLVSTEPLAVRLERRRRRIGSHAGDAEVTEAAERHPRPQLDTPFQAPESDLEKRITEVWQSMLGFDRVGVDDNFFELGGDSFIAVRVASRLKDELGVDLPVARLYEGMTVRALAALLGQADEQDAERAALLEERREAGDRRRELLARRRQRPATD